MAGGPSDDPFAVLGRHDDARRRPPGRRHPDGAARGIRGGPGDAGRPSRPMERRGDGLFELDGRARWRRARTSSPIGSACTRTARVRDVVDPYQFGQVLAEFDLHLFSEGTHYRAWEKLGSHRLTIGTVTGVHFAVWAPNAQRVSVHRRLQPVGRARPPDAPAGAVRRVGDLRPGRCPTAPATSTRCARRRAPGGQGRSLRAAVRDAAEHRVDRLDAAAPTPGATASGCAIGRGSSGGTTGRWRSTRCTSSRGGARRGRRALPDVPRAGRDARALRPRDGLHAHRAAAGDGASRSSARGATR